MSQAVEIVLVLLMIIVLAVFGCVCNYYVCDRRKKSKEPKTDEENEPPLSENSDEYLSATDQLSEAPPSPTTIHQSQLVPEIVEEPPMPPTHRDDDPFKDDTNASTIKPDISDRSIHEEQVCEIDEEVFYDAVSQQGIEDQEPAPTNNQQEFDGQHSVQPPTPMSPTLTHRSSGTNNQQEFEGLHSVQPPTPTSPTPTHRSSDIQQVPKIDVGVVQEAAAGDRQQIHRAVETMPNNAAVAIYITFNNQH
ncbi:hypothetical protein RND81_07G112300 [Saponaria officinalis]|uniref:Uncharacterized protein n=1 Tax=Saponaria officinalis TaxID=3572 RepID=A0AAW1JQN1_SAPOF